MPKKKTASQKAREEAARKKAQEQKRKQTPSTSQTPPTGRNIKAKVDIAETIIGTVALSLVYGGIVCMLCYLGWMAVNSVLGQVTGSLLYDLSIGFAGGLVSKVGLSAGFGTLLAFGIPGAIFAYHLIYAIANDQLGFSFKNDIPSLISGASYALPYASFGICMMMGITLAPALWATFFVATGAGLFMSELGQSIFQPIISNLTNRSSVPPPIPPHDGTKPTPKPTSKPGKKNNFGTKPSKTITTGFDATKKKLKTTREQAKGKSAATKPVAKQTNAPKTTKRTQPARKAKRH